MAEKSFGLNVVDSFQNISGAISIDIELSWKSFLGLRLFSNPVVYVEIYKDSKFHALHFLNEIVSSIHEFSLVYPLHSSDNYVFKIYLDCGIEYNHELFSEFHYIFTSKEDLDTLPSSNHQANVIFPLAIAVIAAPPFIILYSIKKARDLESRFKIKE